MAEHGPVDPVRAATWFAERGFKVFPVWGPAPTGGCSCNDPHDGSVRVAGRDPLGRRDVAKHPATKKGFKDATGDVARIATFLANPGTRNYGLVAPPGVLIIDVDGTGVERLAELERLYGPLPLTLTTLTANGCHYYFRWPGELGAMPNGKLFGFVVRREDDGYVIGPGSVHQTGVVYDVLRDAADMPYPIADLPQRWAEAAAVAKRTAMAVGKALPDVGGRHDFLRDTARHFAGTVRDPDALKAAVMATNAKLPQPKSEAEVDKAIGDVLARFPPDPLEVDPDTGTLVRMRPDEGGEYYDPLASSAFPDPPAREAFGGLAGEVTDAIAEYTDASEVGLLATFIAMAGGLLGARGIYHTVQPAAVMTGLVGITSEARKSTTIELAWDVLMSATGASYTQRFDGLNSGEALVARLMKMQATGVARGVLVEDEFSRLLVSSRREGSTLDAMLRTAFDGRALNVFTRNSSADLTVVPPYVVSSVSAITPKELRKLITPTMLVNGSVNRWLWVPVVRRPVVSVGDRVPSLPPALVKSLRDAASGAYRLIGPLGTEVGAAAMLNDYGSWLSAIEGLAGDMGRRLNVIAFRVALVHALLDRAAAVGVDHVGRAIALTEYGRAGLGWVFGQLTGMKEADLLARAVASAGPLGMTMTEVTRKLIRSPVLRQEAIDAACELGLVRVDRIPNAAGTGRPIQRLVWVPEQSWVGGVSSTYYPKSRDSASATRTRAESPGNNGNKGDTHRDDPGKNSEATGPAPAVPSHSPTPLGIDAGGSLMAAAREIFGASEGKA